MVVRSETPTGEMRLVTGVRSPLRSRLSRGSPKFGPDDESHGRLPTFGQSCRWRNRVSVGARRGANDDLAHINVIGLFNRISDRAGDGFGRNGDAAEVLHHLGGVRM